MIESISESTLLQYTASYRAWWDFCKDKGIDPFEAGVPEVLDFMQNELDFKKAKYGTFNQHRSALSLILPNDIGKNLLIRRFLRAVARLRPPRPRYNITWDPNVVLDNIRRLDQNEDLPLIRLSRKLAILLALATGQRIQTLSLIKVENIIFTEEGSRIYIPDRIKTTKVKSFQPCLELPIFHERRICVTSALLSYIERTSEHRSSTLSNLFITTREPYRAASKNSIARWIKMEMAAAGVNTNMFSPHSTRHASTSAAARLGISWDTIRKSAGWSEKSKTFARFYNRPLIGAIPMTSLFNNTC